MLGVAMPGIAPLAPGVPKEEPVPFAPEQTWAHAADAQRAYIERSLPEGPSQDRAQDEGVRPRKQPPSAFRHPATLAIFSALLLALGAACFALLWRSPAPLRAEPRVDATGKDMLHITCASCPDGTSLRLESAVATVKDQAADLSLSAPLRVGENKIDVDVDRPASGRDERVSLAVQIAYRIRPDLSLLDSDRPTLRIAVEAVPSSAVTVDGRPVAVGPDGKGTYDADLTGECTGAADDVSVIDKSIPYEIKVGSAPAEKSSIAVRVSVPPLHIDAPMSHAVVEIDRFLLAGRTAKGGRLSVSGHAIPVAPDGSFAQMLANLGLGDSDVVVRANLPGQASRLVHVGIKRVAKLSDEARDFAAHAPLVFADVAADVAARVGQPLVLAGEVVEARSQNHQTIALLDVVKACAQPTCLARIVFAGDDAAKRGEHVQVYGHVHGAFASPGKESAGTSVPEVTADFVIKGR
jgi:hypothetical protein